MLTRVNGLIGRFNGLIGRVSGLISRVSVLISRVNKIIGRVNRIIGRVILSINACFCFDQIYRQLLFNSCIYALFSLPTQSFLTLSWNESKIWHFIDDQLNLNVYKWSHIYIYSPLMKRESRRGRQSSNERNRSMQIFPTHIFLNNY